MLPKVGDIIQITDKGFSQDGPFKRGSTYTILQIHTYTNAATKYIFNTTAQYFLYDREFKVIKRCKILSTGGNV